MRTALLPAAQRLYDAENSSLGTTSAQATGLPLIAVTLAVGLGLGGVLYLASRWLRRRTNRVLNAGLVVAGAVVVVSLAWLAVAYAGGRSDLLAAQARGSTPVAALARVDIAAQQAHADESLTLIDNSGDDVYQQDYLTEERALGPGPGTLLTAAAAAAAVGSPAAAPAVSVVTDAKMWYLDHAKSPRARRQRQTRRGRPVGARQRRRRRRPVGSHGCRPTSTRRWQSPRPRSTSI